MAKNKFVLKDAESAVVEREVTFTRVERVPIGIDVHVQGHLLLTIQDDGKLRLYGVRPADAEEMGIVLAVGGCIEITQLK